MGGSRDYKKVSYFTYKRDADGNPVYMNNGEVAVERKYRYIRVTEYKNRQQAQENRRNAEALSRMSARMQNRRNSGNMPSLEERVRQATEAINQATDKKTLKSAMDNLGLSDKTSFIKEMKSIEGAKEVATALAVMNATFGGDVITDITTKGTFANGVGGFRTVGSTVIHLNPKWFNDPEGTQNMLDDQVARGHFHKGENLQSLVKHEYGHLLQDKLTAEVRNSDVFKKNASRLESERENFNKLISDLPSNEREKIHEYIDKAFHATTSKSVTSNINKAIKLLYVSKNYVDARFSLSRQSTYVLNQNNLLHNAEIKKIQQIFNRVGAYSPTDVSIGLTGGTKAYARQSWAEAHAECISDYMTNGPDGASATAIRYVQEFAKEIGVIL